MIKDYIELAVLAGLILLLLYVIIHNWKSCFYWVFKALLTIVGWILGACLVLVFLVQLYEWAGTLNSNYNPLSGDLAPCFDQDFSALKKVSLAARHNNPGNLRPIDSKSGFRQFPNMESGYKALIIDLELKISGRSKFTCGEESLEELIYIYAPPSENNSHAYVSKVAAMMGVDSTEPIANLDVHRLAKAMIRVEDVRLFHQLYPVSLSKLTIKDTLSAGTE